MKTSLKKILASGLMVTVLYPSLAHAYSIDQIDIGSNNDVLITPAKVELSLIQGQAKDFTIKISNRLDKEANFKISVVDILPSDDSEEVLKIKEINLSNAVNFVKPEINSFSLKSGQEITLPVFVSVPLTASSGGYQVGLLVTLTTNDPNAPTVLKSRLGVLTLLKVGKELNEKGELAKFATKDSQRIYFGGEINSFVSFKNTGNVYLNPYGKFTVKDTFGNNIEEKEIRPWFVLPTQTRTTSLPQVYTDWKFGKYTLLLELNRGYQDLIDKEFITIYIFSKEWLMIIGILLLIVAGIFLRLRKASKGETGRGVLFYIYIVVLLIALALIITFYARAERATSTNYILERDSINIGGDRSTSSSYIGDDTLGEVATGKSTSTTYALSAGYQQLDVSTISITSPSNVDLSPNIHPTEGGQSNGTATWKVTTNSPNGYSLSIKASQAPAMKQVGGGDSFSDYTRAGANPDYDWSVASGAFEFGYSPNSVDLSSRWKNDGNDCGVGATITDLKCWDGHTTNNVLISTSAVGNYPSGATTSVHFRAESNAGTLSSGDYQATLTLTALAL